MTRNILVETTEMLYEQIKRLNAADKDDVMNEVERSKGMDQLANGIRANIGTELAVEKFRYEYQAPRTSQRLLNG